MSRAEESAAERPWRDRSALAGLVAAWRPLAGRPLHQVIGGPGWLAVGLAGPERLRLNLVCRAGACLLWTAHAAPPADLAEALGRTRRHPVAALLAGASLQDVGLLPVDLVLALAFAHPTRGPLVLLQQLFGPRGNLALLDGQARRLWALHRSLHAVLTELPPAATWRPAPVPAAATAPSAMPAAPSEPAAPAPPPTAPADPGDLFREAAERHLRAALATEVGGRLLRAVRRSLAAAERLEANLGRDLAAAERGDQQRREAETLAVHLPTLRRGQSEASLPAADGRGTLHIRLDPALGPVENMELRFRQARRAERGLRLVQERLERTEREVAELAAARGQLELLQAEPHDRLAGLLAWWRQHPDLAGEPPAGGPGAGGAGSRGAGAAGVAPLDESRPFRRYRIEGRWEVWVGRSAGENDELTHHRSSPEDLWLHAEGVPGSHVILRTAGRPQDVPGRVIEKAAALAALHSRARHSALVPVLCTRRKYVRKPRRSAPGTASLLQGRTVFAAPGVPAGVEPI